MKRIVRFRDKAGSIRVGNWKEEGIEFGGEIFDPDEVDILPPCEPSKIICIGRNYAEHAKELKNVIPDRPLLFLKTPNCLSGHEDTIKLLSDKKRIDYEAELAVVIGEQCKNVHKEEALDYVKGYTCAMDISNRDDQNKEQNWVRGKAFDNSLPVGPVIVPQESVQEDARIQLRLNNDIKQDSTIDKMAFSVSELIEEITKYITLEKGDIIATGTPEGVGPLSDGDVVEVEIEGIGVLRNYFKKSSSNCYESTS